MAAEPPWDLFRTFAAVIRCGGFTAAARGLRLSQSTISRHVALLEEDAGSPLFERTAPVQLTERGTALLAAVEAMGAAAAKAHAALESTAEVEGEVTLTTVGEIVRWVLARRLADLYRSFPLLRVTILADNRVHSLAGNEADIALRMARPSRGELVARKLAVESFGLYASSLLELGPGAPWLGLGGSLARIPEQGHARRAFASRAPRLLVEDVDSLGIAVEAGLGVAVLPRLYAARLERVVEVRPSSVGARDLGPIASRALWLVVHRSKRNLPKVRAVSEWLGSVFDAAKGRRHPAGQSF